MSKECPSATGNPYPSLGAVGHRGGVASTLSGLAWLSESEPRVARYAANPGLKEAIPLGLADETPAKAGRHLGNLPAP